MYLPCANSQDFKNCKNVIYHMHVLAPFFHFKNVSQQKGISITVSMSVHS